MSDWDEIRNVDTDSQTNGPVYNPGVHGVYKFILYSICLITIAVFLWLGIMSGMALTEYRPEDIQAVCPGSVLWSCLLCMVGMSFLAIGAGFPFVKTVTTRSFTDTHDTRIRFVRWGLVWFVGIYVWEFVEVWGRPCTMNHLTKTSVYELLITYWVVTTVIAILAGLWTCICACERSAVVDD